MLCYLYLWLDLNKSKIKQWYLFVPEWEQLASNFEQFIFILLLYDIYEKIPDPNWESKSFPADLDTRVINNYTKLPPKLIIKTAEIILE